MVQGFFIALKLMFSYVEDCKHYVEFIGVILSTKWLNVVFHEVGRSGIASHLPLITSRKVIMPRVLNSEMAASRICHGSDERKREN